MKVVHVAYECAPIYKVGGLGDVAGSLPIEMAKLGVHTFVVMPDYGWIKKLSYLPGSRVSVFYASSPWLVKPNIKNDPQVKALTYAHFCLQTLELLKTRHICPDILHCHDWHTGLIPFLIKKANDPFFARTKTVLTIHNVAFQGNFPLKYLKEPDTQAIVNFFPDNQKKISYLAQGIKYADFVTTVSPHHAREIRQGEVSFGLRQAVRLKKKNFIGILNGIDQSVWNPHTDNLIYQKYSVNDVVSGKKANKLKFQKEFNLVENYRIPIFGFVARLSTQKGIEFLLPLLETAHQKRIEVVILGKGDRKSEKLLSQYQNKITQGWVSVNIGFNEKIAHQIYAAADFILIPSRYEPCGLTQMISMRYGTIPIASAVGGLKDSIIEGKTGFLISRLNEDNFMKKINEALNIWQDESRKNKMIKSALAHDFSWKKSAGEYLHLYNRLLKE